MYAYLAVAFAALFASLLLKDKNRTFAVLISFSGSVIILLLMFSGLKGVVEKLRDIAALNSSSQAYIKLMLKVLGITLLTGFVGNVCRDNGESALAGVTETFSKVIIITLVLPLFEAVITIVGGILK
ncbi:MAG: hypothetical protein IJT65_06125 [Eubacterium sp.]|nr:hypothetical protein [Eubacterium sp.]